MTRLRFLPLLILAIAGCKDAPGRADGKVRVVATTGMIADAAREIGGPAVSVETLMGPGIDPHRYAATTGDLAKIATADVVFFNGLHLEGKMTDVLEKRATGKGRAVAVARDIPESSLRKTEDSGGGHDPHVWFDPEIWVLTTDVIRDELAASDPAHATDYAARAAAYRKRILDEHANLQALVATLPEARRILVTSHDAFEYFGRRYGFQVRGLQGVSTASEMSIRDVQDLTKFLGKNRVPAIFGETSVPTKGLESVRAAVKKEFKLELKLVGDADALYSDALGPAGTTGETYLGMLRHNVTVIVNALKAAP